MVVKITTGGLKSYDPLEAAGIKKKKKKEEKPKSEAKKPLPTKVMPPKPDTIETFKSPSGRPSGITLPDGRTFLGLSPDEVEEITQRETKKAGALGQELTVGKEGPPTGIRLAAAEQLEQAGAFEKVTPKEVPLTPEKQFAQELPFIGTSTAALQSVLGSAARRGWLGPLESENQIQFPLTPETLREQTLNEIRDASFQEGISTSESFGALIESIPVVGSLVNKYASGLTQTPSKNADTVVAEINKIKEAASTGQEKVRNGLEDPEYGLSRARLMEEDVAKLEGRLKLLINTSAVLRANRDNVNMIQEQILEAREKISRYRQASVYGYTAELTGTGRAVPTDEQLFFELKRLKGGKS